MMTKRKTPYAEGERQGRPPARRCPVVKRRDQHRGPRARIGVRKTRMRVRKTNNRTAARANARSQGARMRPARRLRLNKQERNRDKSASIADSSRQSGSRRFGLMVRCGLVPSENHAHRRHRAPNPLLLRGGAARLGSLLPSRSGVVQLALATLATTP